MNEQELKELKATMPWTERVYRTPKGGVVQMVNNRGEEVPLFSMTNFLTHVTAAIARSAVKEAAATTEAQGQTA